MLTSWISNLGLQIQDMKVNQNKKYVKETRIKCALNFKYLETVIKL